MDPAGNSMRRMLLLLAATILGCQACPVDTALDVEGQVATVAFARALPDTSGSPLILPAATAPGMPLQSLDLAALWNLALANSPSLREAAADVEVALGRRLQAEKYPNPRLGYSEENLGTSAGPAGAVKVQVTQ